MSQLKIPAFLSICLLFVAMFSPDGARQRKGVKTGDKTRVEKVAGGAWGSNKAVMQVTENGATIEFGCAHGTIEQPLTLDNNNGFDLSGSYTVERPGPQIEGQNNNQPARFNGQVNGQTMTLNITLTRTKQTIGPLILNYGKTGRIMRCQ